LEEVKIVEKYEKPKFALIKHISIEELEEEAEALLG
jgi:hypothetical protein